MENTRYTMAPALIVRWDSCDLHPVIFNADRTKWIPATHSAASDKVTLPNWNMGRHLPGSRRKLRSSEISYLAVRFANTRLMNEGKHVPVPAYLNETLDKAFAEWAD